MGNETFGKRLKDLRVEKKLTQVELAKELKIDKSTIAKYETDKIEPSVSMLKVLVDYFKVSAGYILGWED
ncbi:MAG: helix-turn-helix transcriptional regulator [Clostridia bacterium]|nr:helix-turn-helix transcriptional regulator [Clostridia bacterium]